MTADENHLGILLRGMPSRLRALGETGFIAVAMVGEIIIDRVTRDMPPENASFASLLMVILLFVLLIWGGVLAWARRQHRVTRLVLLGLAIFTPAVVSVGIELAAGLHGHKIYHQALGRLATTRPLDDDADKQARFEGAAAADQYANDGRFISVVSRGISMLVLVGVVLNAAGQGPAQIGMPRHDALLDIALGIPAFFGCYIVLIMVGGFVMLLYFLGAFPNIEAEAQQRVDVISSFPKVSLLPSVGVMAMVGLYEEIVFRGFLLPRLKHLLRWWWLAILVSSSLFGIAHMYMGPVAVLLTGSLGLYFAIIFITRGRVLTCVVAHALFDTVQYAFIQWLLGSGAVQKLL